MSLATMSQLTRRYYRSLFNSPRDMSPLCSGQADANRRDGVVMATQAHLESYAAYT